MNFVAALLAIAHLFVAAPAWAAAEHELRVGFKTLGLWQAHTQMRADLAVWYPTARAPSDLHYGPWTFRAARNAKELPGLFPLLLISHDSPAVRFSHHGTAEALARSGFVVAALTHHGDNMNDMGHLFTLEQLRSRTAQISAALDTLLTHQDTQSFIDPHRIGLIGFGVGATTALLLGGAVLDGDGWSSYCPQAEEDDPYCSPWAAERMHNLAASLPLKNSSVDKRIKAVALVAPAYCMLFSRDSLRGLRVPLLLLRAKQDRINRVSPHGDTLKDNMPRPVEYAVIPGDLSSLTSACPPVLLRELPDLCSKLPPERRTYIHQQLNKEISRFFLEHLGQIAAHEPEEATPPPSPIEPKAQTPPAPPERTKNKKRKAFPSRRVELP